MDFTVQVLEHYLDIARSENDFAMLFIMWIVYFVVVWVFFSFLNRPVM